MKNQTHLSHAEIVMNMLEELKQGVASDLPSLGLVIPAHLLINLVVYREVIAPNFVPWMAYVWIQCHGKAKKALKGNLLYEIRDDHPEMLRRFVSQAQKTPGEGNWYADWQNESVGVVMKRLQPIIERITSLVRKRNSVDGLLVMAGFENASLSFIPYMKEVGRMMSFTDFEYVDEHETADEDHTKMLALAIMLQAQVLSITPDELAQNTSLNEVRTLLRMIFAK